MKPALRFSPPRLGRTKDSEGDTLKHRGEAVSRIGHGRKSLPSPYNPTSRLAADSRNPKTTKRRASRTDNFGKKYRTSGVTREDIGIFWWLWVRSRRRTICVSVAQYPPHPRERNKAVEFQRGRSHPISTLDGFGPVDCKPFKNWALMRSDPRSFLEKITEKTALAQNVQTGKLAGMTPPCPRCRET